MSLARKFAAIGQAATAPFEEEPVRNLRSGKWFNAKIQPVSEIELQTDLVRDARETDIFYVRDRGAAADTRPQDELQALGGKFLALRRNDNPGSLHVEFFCMKLVPGKDT